MDTCVGPSGCCVVPRRPCAGIAATGKLIVGIHVTTLEMSDGPPPQIQVAAGWAGLSSGAGLAWQGAWTPCPLHRALSVVRLQTAGPCLRSCACAAALLYAGGWVPSVPFALPRGPPCFSPKPPKPALRSSAHSRRQEPCGGRRRRRRQAAAAHPGGQRGVQLGGGDGGGGRGCLPGLGHARGGARAALGRPLKPLACGGAPPTLACPPP